MEIAMSRGLGRVERWLLHEVEANPWGSVTVVTAGADPAEAEASRRAARNLDRKGLAVLRRTRANGGSRSKSILLSIDAAAWDEDEAREKAEKARDERRRATREERKAYESINATEPHRKSELRVTIQRVSGDPMTADLFLSEIEASLGDAWRLDVLEERYGTAQIRVRFEEE